MEARPQLGRTLPNHNIAKEGYLSPGDVERTEAATSMEHQALAKVLPIEMMTWRTTPLFYLQFTVANFSYTPQFYHLL